MRGLANHCRSGLLFLTQFEGSIANAVRRRDRALEQVRAALEFIMPTSLEAVVSKYLRSGNPAQRTREEYATTLRKWKRWGRGVSLEELGRKEIRDFLDWVYEDAADRERHSVVLHAP